jgi:uncharacterized protein YegP (UPF0339 family)
MEGDTGIDVYRGSMGKWRWRLVDNDGTILVPFSAHYNSRQDAYAGARRAAIALRTWYDSGAPEYIDPDDTTPLT